MFKHPHSHAEPYQSNVVLKAWLQVISESLKSLRKTVASIGEHPIPLRTS